MVRERLRRELRRQPRWWPWVMLVSASCTFTALLGGYSNDHFGGPVLHFLALGSSGALVVSSIVLLLVRDRTP